MAVTGQTALCAFLGACDDCGVNTAELRAAMRTWLEDQDMPRAIDPAEGPCALCRDENGSHCAVCGIQFSEKSKRSLDHCHETGKVRGFLCRRCNSVLGLVSDDKSLLGKLAKYLGKHGK